MKNLAILCTLLLAIGGIGKIALAEPSAGAAAFEANCAECHPGGRNIVTPAKDLRVLTLKANGIVSAQDIVAKMRKPGPGMMRFTVQDVPDQEALEIAEYILTTFK